MSRITQGPQAFGNNKLFSGFKAISMFWWNLTPADTRAASSRAEQPVTGLFSVKIGHRVEKSVERVWNNLICLLTKIK